MSDSPPTRPAASLAKLGAATVLIVDEDAGLRESLIDFIEHEGHTVVGVANGKEALDYLLEVPLLPKLVVVELMMPIMDGWELLKEIRQTEKLADVVVVMMSARYTPLADVSDPALPVRRMSKPLDIPSLLALVREICGVAN